MNVWIENYNGCSCTYVALCRRDLPGSCSEHSTYRLFENRSEGYRGEVGLIQGEATE